MFISTINNNLIIATNSFIFVTPILNAGKKGSKYSKPRKTNPVKLNMNLTNIQKDVLVGTLLGDASIEKNKPNHNSRIRFDQTFPMHASYINFLYSTFLNLVGKHPMVNFRKEDKRTGKIYSSISFKTFLV